MNASLQGHGAAPRWRTLSALTVGVLFVHLFLLAGGWPDGLSTEPVGYPADGADAITPSLSADQGSAPVSVAAAPPAITSSRVRWILPKPPEPPPPPPPEVKPAPPKPRPAPPPPSVEPAADVVEAPLLSTDGPEAPPSDTVEAGSTGQRMSGLDHEPTPEPTEPATPGASTAPAELTGPPPTPTPLLPAPSPDEPAVTEQALPPAEVPPSMRLMYEVTGRVKGINYNASGSLDWAHQGDRYEAHMVVRALFVGSREQTSVGTVTSTGLVPERFGDKSRSERAAHFDGENRRIRFSNNAPDAPWALGGQDRLSVFMQLAALLQAQPEAYPPGTIVSLQVTGPGDAETWRFELGAEEMLTLPAGQMKARHIKRAPRKPFDAQTELWLAPQLNHLPVRIRITQHNGDHVEQALRYLP